MACCKILSRATIIITPQIFAYTQVIMEIKVMHAFTDELQAEWDTLLKSSPTNVPFLRFDYQKLWLQTRGGGEW